MWGENNMSGFFVVSASAASATGQSADSDMLFPENNVFISQSGGREMKYEKVSIIGDGAYGTVYKAKDLQNKGNFVAMKKIKIPLSEEGVPASTLREIAVMKRLGSFGHPNIVKLLDICNGRKLEQEQQLVIYLVLEHIDQDLSMYLQQCPPPGLGVERIKDIAFQVLKGLDFLHCNRVIHRDIKPQNILITNQGCVKLADFGLARIYDPYMTLTSVVVTLWYRPPEVLLQREYATSVDIWSAGCVIAELYRRSPLFAGENEFHQLLEIFKIIGTPVESEWPQSTLISHGAFKFSKRIPMKSIIPEICDDGADLLKQMLLFSPTKRICCRDALNHPYLKNVKPTSLNK